MEEKHTFKTEFYNSIEEVWEKKMYIWQNLSSHDLIIFDLDGVIIMWPFSIHTFLFRIRRTKLDAFENVMKNSSAWIFTDRPMIIFKPLEKQLLNVFVKNSNILVENLKVINNESEVDRHISKYSPRRAVFYNAAKRTAHAEKVILKALDNFEKIYYIASQDIHRHYEDLELVKRVEKKYTKNLSQITFIDIKKKWFQR